MVIDSFQKSIISFQRFVMSMQLGQCFSRAKPFRMKKSQKFFDLQKKPKVFKKARISKSGFKKAKLATLLSGSNFFSLTEKGSRILLPVSQ